jgi:hypothetical protein
MVLSTTAEQVTEFVYFGVPDKCRGCSPDYLNPWPLFVRNFCFQTSSMVVSYSMTYCSVTQGRRFICARRKDGVFSREVQ